MTVHYSKDYIFKWLHFIWLCTISMTIHQCNWLYINSNECIYLQFEWVFTMNRSLQFKWLNTIQMTTHNSNDYISIEMTLYMCNSNDCTLWITVCDSTDYTLKWLQFKWLYMFAIQMCIHNKVRDSTDYTLKWLLFKCLYTIQITVYQSKWLCINS